MPPSAAIGLLDVLDQLRSAGVMFDLKRPAPRFELVFTPRPTVAGALWVAPWRSWLTVVAVGRYTGHAPAQCPLCGSVSMVAVVGTSGTKRGTKSEPWPKCRVGPRAEEQDKRLSGCQGRPVPRPVDLDGVFGTKRGERRPPPGIPTVSQWLERQALLALDRWLVAAATETGDLP